MVILWHCIEAYERMRSSIGRTVCNVQLCCERFSISLADITGSLFSVRAIDDVCRDKVDDDVIRNVECITELAMIRDNMLQLSSDVFSLMDITDVISFYVLVSLIREFSRT